MQRKSQVLCRQCRYVMFSGGKLECRVNPPKRKGFPIVKPEQWCAKGFCDVCENEDEHASWCQHMGT